jgi:hypothetical protein
MLAGACILVLVPLMDLLQKLEWASKVPVPAIFDYRGTVRTLDDTLLSFWGVYQPLVFCIGVVLLFSRERGRRPDRLDWTRRWGVGCSYVSLLLAATPVLFISALVLAGVAALCLSMPLKYQPGVTPLFVNLSVAYLRYGPYPTAMSGVVLVAFSSIAVLLSCIPLFDALRSSGPKRLAAILLAPLAFFALMHLAQVGRYCLTYSISTSSDDIFHYQVYFWPALLVGNSAGYPSRLNVSGSALFAFWVEAAKWCIVLAIAVWLSIAQLLTWRQGKKPNAA